MSSTRLGTRIPTRTHSVAEPRRHRPPARDDHRDTHRDNDTEWLFAELARVPDHSEEAHRICARLAKIHAPVVEREARRYRDRGVAQEDLRQVARVGLMKAIRGFDPGRGKPFMSYLLPTMTGELKRHFRDNTWAVHAPRAHQERRAELNRFTTEFTQRHSRSPSLTEIGAHMGLDAKATGEMLGACSAYSALSLDRPYGTNEEGEETMLGDSIGAADPGIELAVDREALKQALVGIPPRERRILLLRFFGDQTQAQIAEAMGCSQMHVSRLLNSTLTRLRRAMLHDS
ncbi:RNA polymerase sigma-28 (SigD/FliA/WhiG) subunit [Murinocardiopsis flavida]|uniref:RNA polymerase sigma-28 (SigD/FliA/WhiG) subunit n=1 Tax=Murinocardiopsis flavida TaxID=645275 RepID=A0A2P8DTV4_9ACTN|nr:SigB/SigF/SigG family RNA polymerase sigma factor [Murinocardiopsis flavida]PSL00622.1 RNA polymerase sigma-28 (SigD/FliA/WhiG) subunit [Murinocardiopsis flavida]